MSNRARNQHSHHHGKRKHDDVPWHDVVQEEAVDDLLVASMAVASAWCDEASPALAVEKSSTSNSENESDDSKEDHSDSDDDDAREHDADEISIFSSDQDGPTLHLKENDDKKLTEESDIDKETLKLRIKKEDESEDDDVSEIDLAEHLANMEDDDEDAPKNAKGNKSNVIFGIYEGPKTEHEIDPYTCPTDELAKLNVCVGFERDNLEDPTILNDATRSRLRIAGTIRTYLKEQRTIVVDSLIPAALQSDCQNYNSVDAPLDEGSMLAILLEKRIDETCEITALKKDSTCSLEILGRIAEVFGPVQRPLYVIRLPDPPKAEKSLGKLETEEKPKKEPLEKTSNRDGDAAGSLVKIEVFECTENIKDIEKTEFTLSGDEKIDGSVSIGAEPDRSSSMHGLIGCRSEGCEIPEPSAKEDDPWSHNGKLSCILRNSPNVVVYSLVDHVKLIDRELIIRASGRGCDASNMFDEEVGPSEQQDFSDDEEERQAKKGNRKSRQAVQNDSQSERRRDGHNNFNGRCSAGRSSCRGRGRGNGRGMGTAHGNLDNSYQQQHQQRFYHAQPTSAMQCQYPNPGYTHTQQPHPPQTSQQFHQGSYSSQFYQQPYQAQPFNNYVGYPGYIYGTPPPPPPPPPRQNNTPVHSQPQQTPNAVPSSAFSDTVYYDYSGS